MAGRRGHPTHHRKVLGLKAGRKNNPPKDGGGKAEEGENWGETTEEYEEDESYQFSKMPGEQWREHMPNYLQIASDYGVGCLR